MAKPNLKSAVVARGEGRGVATLDDKGKAPKERLKDASALHSIYVRALRDDDKSARNRAILKNHADGAPPVSDASLAASGLSWQYNLNFLSSDSKLQAAITAYSDLLDSTNGLVEPDFYPDKIAPEDVQDNADVISEEHSRLVREGSNFYYVWERLGGEFVNFGTGFGYYPDTDTPWWDAAGWNEFVMPRRTKVGEENIPILMWQHSYRVHELYAFIRDPEHSNWNVEEVQRAIVCACETPTKDKPWQSFWGEIEISLKNNDLSFGISHAEEVHALHGLVREFDGSVSFYIGLINGSNEEHLYKDVGRYEKMSQAVVTFTLGVGNGTYHSIRGLLWKLYPFGTTLDRINNKLLTQTDLAMSLCLQATDSESLDDMTITIAGPVAYLPPKDKAEVVVRTLPDVGTQGLPIIDHLNNSMSAATGQFESSRGNTSANSDNRHNLSKFQYQAEQEHAGALTNNSVNRFYRSLDRLMAEQFRRIQKIGPKSKRFPEVEEFYERCAERGVPAEVIQKGVRTVRAVRAIGNGSPAVRAVAMDKLLSISGNFDESGRNLLARDVTTLYADRAAADRYCPRQTRVAPDAEIANLENAALRSGPMNIVSGQNHSVHASVHVPEFQKAIEQLVATREQDPSADFTELKPVLQYAFNLHGHSAQHVEAMAADPLRVKDAKAYRAALETGGNLLAGMAREVAAQERHQVGQDGQPSGEQLDNQKKYNDINAGQHQLEFAAQRSEQTLRHAEEDHQLELGLASARIADVAQKMRLRDIETASALREQKAKSAASGA